MLFKKYRIKRKAFKIINEARSNDDLTIEIADDLPANIEAILGIYGKFASTSFDSGSPHFYILNSEGLDKLDNRRRIVRAECRANIAIVISIISIIASIITIVLKYILEQ